MIPPKCRCAPGNDTETMCVCSSHSADFFLPVDIQHTPAPCCFFILERCKLLLWSQDYGTDTASSYHLVMLQKETMSCHAILPRIRRAQYTHASSRHYSPPSAALANPICPKRFGLLIRHYRDHYCSCNVARCQIDKTVLVAF